MKEWFDGLVAQVKGLFSKNKKAEPELITTVSSSYEINLVPEVKMQMIQAQKIRNLVLFICIVVAAASVGVVLVLFGIKSGQDIAMANQDKKLETMSSKLAGYGELGDLVTIQGQLDKLGEIADRKTVLSRVFGALRAMLPTTDTVQLSELRVDLDTNTLRMEAQADARTAPLIDYRVLESFKKGVALTKYDYGQYVDSNGAELPTWCVRESDDAGNALRVGESYYAWWDLTAEGCAALAEGDTVPENSEIEFFYNKESEVEADEVEIPVEEFEAQGIEVEYKDDGVMEILTEGVEEREREDGSKYYVRRTVRRVKIWRTPQFTEWHNGGLMELDGAISGVQHFESACIKYTGVMQSGSSIARWTSTNDCMLAPEGLVVSASSNGRDESDNLVLKFTAQADVDPEFFMFKNKHMIAIGPMGQNVTDSYIQIGNMFTQEARECEAGDTECMTNVNNSGGNSGGANNSSTGGEDGGE